MSADGVIGQPLDRVDGRAKVTGSARYAGEFAVANLAHAVAVSAPVASGRVTEIDARAAERAPGVIAVFSHANMPKLKKPSAEDSKGMAGQTFLPLQSDEIQYAGQYVALVVAETWEQARRAAELVRVSYQEGDPMLWGGEADAPTTKPKRIARSDKPDSSRGDVEGALAKAATVVRHDYRMAQENHNPMERSVAVAEWKSSKTGGPKDRLTLYVATQWVAGARHVVAHVLGVSEETVHVICPYVGGGFGCKGSVWPHELLAPALAREIGRPVKFELTRSQMFFGCGSRPQIRQHIELGAEANGKLKAMVHDSINGTSTTDVWAESAAKQTRMLYECANVRTTHRLVAGNIATPCQMRAPGHAPGMWALEVAMDELAYALKMDPLTLRLANYAERDEDEGKPFSSKALRACYEQAGAKFGWERRSAEPGSMREGRTLIGWGMATATYPTNQQKAAARIRLLPDATAIVSSATHDLGTGTYTIMTQIAAETLGLPVDQVRFDLGDSELAESPVSGGSQTAASVGTAVKAGCQKAREELLQIAVADGQSPLHGRKAETLRVEGGRIVGEGSEDSVRAVVKRHGAVIDVMGESAPEDKKYSKHSHGAQFVEVRIDADLPEVRVSRVVSAFAAGRILNEKTGRNQIMGGIVMGIGMALLEGTRYDGRTGKIVNDNLADYLVPVNADVPAIDCFFVDEPDDHVNSLGAKGIGELGVTGIAAAVTNAVFHATGKRIRELPITMEKLM